MNFMIFPKIDHFFDEFQGLPHYPGMDHCKAHCSATVSPTVKPTVVTLRHHPDQYHGVPTTQRRCTTTHYPGYPYPYTGHGGTGVRCMQGVTAAVVSSPGFLSDRYIELQPFPER